MAQPIFALIDCNNFFVSCERLFRPDLEGQPVVVLSSNDGCAVARSNEAKRLGIPMGAPAFKLRQSFRMVSGDKPPAARLRAMQGAAEQRTEPYKPYGEEAAEVATPQRANSGREVGGFAGNLPAAARPQVVQFSANFELYGDVSERITRLLVGVTPHTEVYSVDESFLDLSELRISDYAAWGRTLRQRILEEVGIPVSIGIAASKTLAKIATERAKKTPGLDGVLDLYTRDAAGRAPYLRLTPIEDVWGVGRRLSPKLKAEGIYNALDLAAMRPSHAGQMMGVHGRQMVAELNGQSCIPLETAAKVRQSVMHGRLFGHDTNQLPVIEAAIASLTARATRRLRREGLLARSAVVSLSTNRHKPGYQRIRRYHGFATPTADTGQITAQLTAEFEAVFNPRLQYHRADVLLYDLVSEHSVQVDLLGTVDIAGNQRSQARLKALDALNDRYGKGIVRYAAEDLSQAWTPKHDFRSPRYTTNWQELPVARVS